MLKRDYNYKRKIKRLLGRYGIEPKSYELYYAAFTHPSAAEFPCQSYENLEFLGDALISIHVVLSLVKKYPRGRVGLLSKAKSQIVSGESLAHVARDMGLDKYLYMDDSLQNHGKCISSGIMADVFEALTGAIFLDFGQRVTMKFLDVVLLEQINIDLQTRRSEDFKSILQEEIQRRYKSIPCYDLTRTTGPDHDKIFYIHVTSHGVKMGQGKGKSKKEAEQEAARKTLENLEKHFQKIDDKIQNCPD